MSVNDTQSGLIAKPEKFSYIEAKGADIQKLNYSQPMIACLSTNQTIAVPNTVEQVLLDQLEVGDASRFVNNEIVIQEDGVYICSMQCAIQFQLTAGTIPDICTSAAMITINGNVATPSTDDGLAAFTSAQLGGIGALGFPSISLATNAAFQLSAGDRVGMIALAARNNPDGSDVFVILQPVTLGSINAKQTCLEVIKVSG